MAKVLIVDDDRNVRDSVSMVLRYARHETVEVGRGREALDVLAQRRDIDVVICDVKMPEMDGLDVLEEMKTLDPDLPVIMISGHGDVRTAVEATKRGAFDFFEKPLDQDHLLVAVRNAMERQELKQETRHLRDVAYSRWKIHGESPGMQRVRAMISQVGPKDATVLITGENGTGKELVARNLHMVSRRSKGPFVDVNCAAIPSELIESELFGHEKGAFTGATQRKSGKFEQAHKGTLFLDEIGDMDAAAQAKVLRVLESGEFQRVGGTETITADARIVCATNRDLKTDVTEGRFREDLFYRLSVIPIHLPPLRERSEDIPELVSMFLTLFAKKHGTEARTTTPAALQALRSLPWPGNIRELRNFMERMILLVDDSKIDVQHIQQHQGRVINPYREDVFSANSFEEFKETSERLFLERKIRENDGNIKRTAEVLGMQRSNLYKKIERYNLK